MHLRTVTKVSTKANARLTHGCDAASHVAGGAGKEHVEDDPSAKLHNGQNSSSTVEDPGRLREEKAAAVAEQRLGPGLHDKHLPEPLLIGKRHRSAEAYDDLHPVLGQQVGQELFLKSRRLLYSSPGTLHAHSHTHTHTCRSRSRPVVSFILYCCHVFCHHHCYFISVVFVIEWSFRNLSMQKIESLNGQKIEKDAIT